MTSRRARRGLSIACIAQALFLLAAPTSAGTVWSNPWTVTAPPTLNTYGPDHDAWPSPPASALPSTPAAFAANGDLVFGAATETLAEYQFLRIAPDGTLRWTANLDWYDGAGYEGAEALVATDDGGALVALGNRYGDDGDHVIRIGADGIPLWSRDVPTGWLADVGANRIASANGTTLTVLDATTGDALWQRRINPDDGAEPAGGVAADTAGHIYATFPVGAPALGGTATAFRVMRFDANGSAEWNVETPVADGASIVGTSNSHLYLRTASDVRALRLADGAVAWTQPISPNARVLLTGPPSEMLVIESDSIRRLADDDGSARWMTPLDAAIRAASAIADAVFVGTAAGVAKIDAASGAIAWIEPLPDGTSAVLLAIGGTVDGLYSVARPYAPTTLSPVIRRIDFGSGAVSAPVAIAAVEQGVLESSDVVAAAHLISATWTRADTAIEIRVRSVDAVSGTTAWESVDSLDDSSVGYVAQPGIASDADTVVVATALNNGNVGNPAAGLVRIVLLDRASGSVRWTLNLRDADQLLTIASTPALDVDGNVIVAVGAGVTCEIGDGCERRTVYKLAAADGAVLWRFDEADQIFIDLQVFPQTFALVGSNVATSRASQPDMPVHFLSGADGSTLWSSDAFGTVYAFYPTSDGNLVVFGTGWGKLDAASGATLFTGEPPPTMCTTICFDFDTIVAANDDVLSAGESDYTPMLTRRWGSNGLADTLLPEAATPNLRARFTRVFGEDASGRVSLRLYRAHRTLSDSISFLTYLDLTTGTLGPQQALNGGDDDVLTQTTFQDVQAVTPDSVLGSALFLRPPLAATEGALLLDTDVTAHGDMTAAISAEATRARPGASIAFHATATYTGDAPISGATLVALLPWRGGISDAACATSSATNCVLDVRSGNLRATFDAAPGGSVDVTGHVSVLPLLTDAATLYARTWGPAGLAETETKNNFAQTTLVESLFADGFDGD